MPPIPSYLFLLIFVFVVLPFCTAVVLRLLLYRHIAALHKRVKKLIKEEKSSDELAVNLEAEPKMIQRLLVRFKKASSVLEQVNTPALIDQIYSQEKVGGFLCEQIDYFCRILPNLLLAFGLFCTFLGITINLTALSHTLSQNNYSDVSTLVHKLQTPLQGMGIAFVASLAGLFFSTGLTLVNFKINTALAKLQLISSLEDYLDNIYRPTIEGQSRLDKTVEKMVFTFREFLTGFGVTFREAVEYSLGDNIKEIRAANVKASDLATEVYSRFLDASGTLERGAVIFGEFAEVIERTQFPAQLSTLTEGLANAQKELSQSSLLLNDSMKFTESATKLLHNSVVEIAHLGKKTTQVLELTQASQQSLSEIIPQLHQGAQMFQPVVNTLDELQQRIEIRADSLGDIQLELANLVETLKNHTDQVSLEIQALSNQLVKRIDEQRKGNNFPPRSDNLVEQKAPPPKKPSGDFSKIPEEQFINAKTAYNDGNYNYAAMIVNALIKKFPKMPQFYLLKGDTYYQLQDYTTAKEAYQSVISLSPDIQLIKHANDGLNSILQKVAIRTELPEN